MLRIQYNFLSNTVRSFLIFLIYSFYDNQWALYSKFLSMLSEDDPTELVINSIKKFAEEDIYKLLTVLPSIVSLHPIVEGHHEILRSVVSLFDSQLQYYLTVKIRTESLNLFNNTLPLATVKETLTWDSFEQQNFWYLLIESCKIKQKLCENVAQLLPSLLSFPLLGKLYFEVLFHFIRIS